MHIEHLCYNDLTNQTVRLSHLLTEEAHIFRRPEMTMERCSSSKVIKMTEEEKLTSGEKTGKPVLYGVDDVPPAHMTVLFGLQVCHGII